MVYLLILGLYERREKIAWWQKIIFPIACTQLHKNDKTEDQIFCSSKTFLSSAYCFHRTILKREMVSKKDVTNA